MVYFSSIAVLALAATIANAVPLNKRIAQVINESTVKWEAACVRVVFKSFYASTPDFLTLQNKAGGGQQCNPVSVTAFMTLLAAAGPCEQQNAGDKMIDLAKTLNNDPEMIKFAQIFVQQPRNSVRLPLFLHLVNNVYFL